MVQLALLGSMAVSILGVAAANIPARSHHAKVDMQTFDSGDCNPASPVKHHKLKEGHCYDFHKSFSSYSYTPHKLDKWSGGDKGTCRIHVYQQKHCRGPELVGDDIAKNPNCGVAAWGTQTNASPVHRGQAAKLLCTHEDKPQLTTIISSLNKPRPTVKPDIVFTSTTSRPLVPTTVTTTKTSPSTTTATPRLTATTTVFDRPVFTVTGSDPTTVWVAPPRTSSTKTPLVMTATYTIDDTASATPSRISRA